MCKFVSGFIMFAATLVAHFTKAISLEYLLILYFIAGAIGAAGADELDNRRRDKDKE